MTDFDAFWAAYPRRIAKLAALKAYGKARTCATAEEIIEGVRQYCAHMPDEPRFIAHPASWLNAGRWMDEYDAPVKAPRQYWADECAEIHGGTCKDHWTHGTRRQQERAS